MALAFFIVSFYFLIVKRARRTYQPKGRVVIYSVFVVYVCAMIYYCSYVDSQAQIGMGIPGADMLAHFNGAKRLSEGYSWHSLSGIATRYEQIGLNTLGYFLYTEFLALMIFRLTILPVEVNVYIVYLIQIVFSLNTAMRLSNAYNAVTPKKKGKIQYFLLICTCIPFAVQSSQLMRDIFYMYFLSVLIEHLVMNYYSEKPVQLRLLKGISKSQTKYYVFLMLLIVMAVSLRFYVAIVAVPLLLYYTKHEKVAVICSVAITVLMVIGTSIINIVKEQLGIGWAFGIMSFSEFINFLVFPNIMNQTKYILDWNRHFGRLDVGGCNVPGVYYGMSIWNVYVFPVMLIGVYKQIKDIIKGKISRNETVVWLLMLINIVAVYAMAYDSIDTRPKLLMSIPILFFAAKGLQYATKKIRGFGSIYGGLIFAFVGSLLLMNI